MTTISFTILGQPVSHKNGYHIVTIGNRPAIVKSKAAIAYERDALMQIPPLARKRLTGPLRITLRCFYPNERQDLDESLILDILQDRWQSARNPHGKRLIIQSGVYCNDRQIREKHVYHAIDKANPRVEITIEPMQAQQQEMPMHIADLAEELLGEEIPQYAKI
jgi:Holliday junction resolvase RusA-like endonuclease